MLADRDVEGIHVNNKDNIYNADGNGDSTYVAVAGGLIVGVIAVLVIYVSVDHSAPLPTWIPNAHELRDVIMGSAGAAGKQNSSDDEKKSKLARKVDGVAIPSIAV